jgi:hypothetical protein
MYGIEFLDNWGEEIFLQVEFSAGVYEESQGDGEGEIGRGVTWGSNIKRHSLEGQRQPHARRPSTGAELPWATPRHLLLQLVTRAPQSTLTELPLVLQHTCTSTVMALLSNCGIVLHCLPRYR